MPAPAAGALGTTTLRRMTFPERGGASLDIDAAPEAVWALVADITRMGEWSPECFQADWEDGATHPEAGAHFHGSNRPARSNGRCHA